MQDIQTEYRYLSEELLVWWNRMHADFSIFVVIKLLTTLL